MKVFRRVALTYKLFMFFNEGTIYHSDFDIHIVKMRKYYGISSSLVYKQYISKLFCCTLRDTHFVFYTVFASIYLAKRHDIEDIYVYVQSKISFLINNYLIIFIIYKFVLPLNVF